MSDHAMLMDMMNRTSLIKRLLTRDSFTIDIVWDCDSTPHRRYELVTRYNSKGTMVGETFTPDPCNDSWDINSEPDTARFIALVDSEPITARRVLRMLSRPIRHYLDSLSKSDRA